MAMLMSWLSVISVVGLSMFTVLGKFPGEEKHEVGTLEGDVQNWAVLIENYILQVINKDDIFFCFASCK